MKNLNLSIENTQELTIEELVNLIGGDYAPGLWGLFGPAGLGIYTAG